jgi:hypothetical protein
MTRRRAETRAAPPRRSQDCSPIHRQRALRQHRQRALRQRTGAREGEVLDSSRAYRCRNQCTCRDRSSRLPRASARGIERTGVGHPGRRLDPHAPETTETIKLIARHSAEIFVPDNSSGARGRSAASQEIMTMCAHHARATAPERAGSAVDAPIDPWLRMRLAPVHERRRPTYVGATARDALRAIASARPDPTNLALELRPVRALLDRERERLRQRLAGGAPVAEIAHAAARLLDGTIIGLCHLGRCLSRGRPAWCRRSR